MFRKLFITIAAAFLAVLSFAPAAQASDGPLDAITVGDPALPDDDYDVDLVNKGAITVTMGSINAGCTSATGEGYVRARTPASNPYLVVTDTTFTGCTGPLGIGVTLTQVCDLVVNYDGTPTVDDLFIDVVDGTLVVNECLHVTGPGCTLDVNDSVDADFEEEIKEEDPSTQNLAISGSGLTASNVSGCFGLVPNGASITFSLDFNVISEDGPVNFIPEEA